MLQWLMKGLGMTKKKLINLSKGEETINSDCQSIEEPKGWRFNWRKVIPLEPTAELIILVLLALLLICPLSSRQGAYQDSHGVVVLFLLSKTCPYEGCQSYFTSPPSTTRSSAFAASP